MNTIKVVFADLDVESAAPHWYDLSEKKVKCIQNLYLPVFINWRVCQAFYWVHRILGHFAGVSLPLGKTISRVRPGILANVVSGIIFFRYPIF